VPPPPTRTPPPTFTPTPVAEQAQVDPNAAATAQAVATQSTAQQEQAQQTQEQQNPPPAQAAQATPAAPQAAATITPTVEPTATAAAQVAEVVVNSQINIRQGPGTNYNIIGAANQGERFPVTGKNQAGDWWQINYRGQAGWVFGQLVTPQNTGAVAVAQNIPAPPPPPPPTNTPVPQPTQPPAAQPPPAPAEPNYEFNVALLQKCDPNAGVTYVDGTTYKNGQPASGYLVAFSYAPDGPIVAKIQSGPHQGYPGWRQGFYSHILQTNGPREGTWYFWVVDQNDKRISKMVEVRTDGQAGDGKCQQAIVDFDSR
jgi:hypothetical protein